MVAEEKTVRVFTSLVLPVVLLSVIAVTGWVLFAAGGDGSTKGLVEVAALAALVCILIWYLFVLKVARAKVESAMAGKRVDEDVHAAAGEAAGGRADSRFLDDLTGLSARSWFNECFRLEIARDVRYNHPFSVLLIDVDGFSRINRTFGRAGGDYVLRSVAEILKKTVRQTDQLARFADDEFAVIVPETDESGAHVVGEKIRRAVELYPFDEGKEITVSIGVSTIGSVDSAESCLERAEASMTIARKRGGNAVVTAPS